MEESGKMHQGMSNRYFGITEINSFPQSQLNATIINSFRN